MLYGPLHAFLEGWKAHRCTRTRMHAHACQDTLGLDPLHSQRWQIALTWNRMEYITPSQKNAILWYLSVQFDTEITMTAYFLYLCIFSFKNPSPKVLPFHLLNIISQSLKDAFNHFTSQHVRHVFTQTHWFGNIALLLPLFNLAAIRTHTDEAFRALALSSHHVKGILLFIHFLMHSN